MMKHHMILVQIPLFPNLVRPHIDKGIRREKEITSYRAIRWIAIATIQIRFH